MFSDVVEEPATYVDAPLRAERRGQEVTLTSEPDSHTFRNLATARGAMAGGARLPGSGTIYGENQVSRLTDLVGRIGAREAHAADLTRT